MQSIQTWVGIDVSAKTLSACRWRADVYAEKEFDNDSRGHRELVRWVGKHARICMEATGVYHLGIAMALDSASNEVMVVNPRVAKDFARAMSTRSKTDEVDARTLLEFVRRMDFQPWQRPSVAVLELRELARRVTELVKSATAEKNRLHARGISRLSATVVADVKANVAQLKKRVARIERAAFDVIVADADLREQYRILIGVPGIARRTAILLLGELAVLDRTMTERQLVAYAGLDPRVFESGTSVLKPVRISKVGNSRLRAILYMNALSAVRHDHGARAFFHRLVARGKKRKQALVAVMRKLLHGIWIVLRRRVDFNTAVLFASALAKAECPHSAIAAEQPELSQDHPKDRSEAEELRQQLDAGSAEASRRPRKEKAA
ncbi:MAG TPA: IS110 family transposase [Gemmatimonadaceae bacterium]